MFCLFGIRTTPCCFFASKRATVLQSLGHARACENTRRTSRSKTRWTCARSTSIFAGRSNTASRSTIPTVPSIHLRSRCRTRAWSATRYRSRLMLGVGNTIPRGNARGIFLVWPRADLFHLARPGARDDTPQVVVPRSAYQQFRYVAAERARGQQWGGLYCRPGWRHLIIHCVKCFP